MKKDYIGQKFGRFTVIGDAEDAVNENGRRRRRVMCQCECGKIKTVYVENLTRGISVSCGCYQKEQASKANSIHHSTGTRLYGIWTAMKSRCDNPHNKEYPIYGGRGIRVCDEWSGSFEAFGKWMHEHGYRDDAPRGECTIDRIDCDKGYCPENCRIITQQEQMYNIRTNVKIVINGEEMNLREASLRYGINKSKLYQRIKKFGYTPEEAVSK